MNNNSFICKLINDNPDSWETICESKNIRVKKDATNPYVIFNYEINADFTDPVVQEARGIIIDIEKLEVIAWPFRKFGNFSESYADTIDWNTAEVQEKVDGSLIKFFYDQRNHKWAWATNSCIYASDANSASGRTFMKMIEQTKEYSYMMKRSQRGENAEQFTYLFELVGPDNQVVIRYDKPMLYHIGTRNNVTGQEVKINIGVTKPRVYSLHSLTDCKRAVCELNKNDFPDAEGFVVCDADWHRVKVKCPEYLLWHHAVNNGAMNKEVAYDLYTSDDFSFETFTSNVSEYVAKQMKFYVSEFERVTKGIIKTVEFVDVMNMEGHTRKEIAQALLNSEFKEFSTYGFKFLDVQKCPKLLIELLGSRTFLKCVKDFEEE